MSRSRSQRVELADGVGDGEEPAGRGGHPRSRVNPLHEFRLGRGTAHMSFARLVDGRPRCKRRAGRGRGAHKAGYGTVKPQATDPAPAPGAAAPTPGGQSPAPARTRRAPAVTPPARIPAAPAQHDRPGPRPRSPGAAMTGGGPAVNASPPGLLSRSGPGGVTRRAGAEDGAAVDTPGTRRLSGLFPGSVSIPVPDFG